MPQNHEVDPLDELTRIAAGLAGKRVVMTGASGFIGRRLLQVLGGAGVAPVVLIRDRRAASRLRDLGAIAVICDLARGQIPSQALRGAEVLIHLAYDMRASGTENLRAGAELFTQAEAAQVGRIVHLSSVVVYDDWPEGPIAEDSPRWGAGGSGYRQAKIGLERRLAEGSLPSVILQPTIVYGPGSALWTDAPIAALERGVVVLPDPPGLAPLVHVDDVVQAIIRAALLPDPGCGRTFLISGADPVDWASYLRGLSRRIGRGEVRLERMTPPPPVSDKADPLSIAARISRLGRRLVGRRAFEHLAAGLRRLRPASGPVRPDSGTLRLYMASPQVSIAAARNQLGYRPLVDLDRGLGTIAR